MERLMKQSFDNTPYGVVFMNTSG